MLSLFATLHIFRFLLFFFFLFLTLVHALCGFKAGSLFETFDFFLFPFHVHGTHSEGRLFTIIFFLVCNNYDGICRFHTFIFFLFFNFDFLYVFFSFWVGIFFFNHFQHFAGLYKTGNVRVHGRYCLQL